MSTTPVPEIVSRGISSILAAAMALPSADDLAAEIGWAEKACGRGYFFPDEDAVVRLRYSQYLTLRGALLTTLGDLSASAGNGDVEWRNRLPVFTTAFAAACVLMRATRFVIDLAKDRDVVWKKLDEEDPVAGIPRKTFTTLYKAVSGSANPRRFIAAADFYFRHRDEIFALAATHGELTPILELLESEEPTIERRRRDALKRLFAYRWFSLLRRHRSAWNQVMFGLFKASGSAIAELRQPGIKSPLAPKRLTAGLRHQILARAEPGDIFVTRHDDALSNLFLPGFWPHAALYLGTRADLDELGAAADFPESPCGHWFLEAKKDGVRFRAAEETLEIDACVVLRSPLTGENLATAIRRAMTHQGKPYDFLFDFRTQDRLACTEVIYRGFHGCGPVLFHLEEVGGRLCLPAEELINQALQSGFRVIATGGLGNGGILSGTKAEIAFHGSRQPL
jgi:hypothetical protein